MPGKVRSVLGAALHRVDFQPKSSPSGSSYNWWYFFAGSKLLWLWGLRKPLALYRSCTSDIISCHFFFCLDTIEVGPWSSQTQAGAEKTLCGHSKAKGLLKRTCELLKSRNCLNTSVTHSWGLEPIYFLIIASIFIEEIIFWSIKEFQISKFQKGWNKSILPKHVDGRLEISYFWKKILKDHSAFIWRNHTGYKVNTSESVSHSDAIIMS